MEKKKIFIKDIIIDKVIENVMVIYVVFGGLINLLFYILVIVYVVNCKIFIVEDWIRINKKVFCLVDVLLNGFVGYIIVKVFLVGGVLEVMFYLRKLGVLYEDVLIVIGEIFGLNFDWWEKLERCVIMKK